MQCGARMTPTAVRALFLACPLALFGAVTPASASLISYDVFATVTQVSNDPAGLLALDGVVLGTPLLARMTWDTAMGAPDRVLGSADQWTRDGSQIQASAATGPETAATGSGMNLYGIQVTRDPTQVRFSIGREGVQLATAGPNLASSPARELYINLFSSTPALIPGGGGILSQFDPAWWNRGLVQMVGPIGSGENWVLGATIDRVAPVPTPEPGTWSVVLTGLAGVWALSCWRRRSLRAAPVSARAALRL